MDAINAIFQIVILIFSVVIHEVSHGVVAYRLGDPTAKYAGRLTLNPLKHLDPFGSVILPLITYWAGGFIFGWARPVPYNPYNLKNPQIGGGLIGAAGPVSNFLVAGFFALLLRVGVADVLPVGLESGFFNISIFIILINLVLAVFNLVPIPPLDGSKILFALLPQRYAQVQDFLERYGLMLVLVLLLFGGRIIFPVVQLFFRLFVGTPLF